ncbi:hypothetical protein ACFVYR_37680 [Streptomyces sp. NPDC058284]|uniref:hypothetical protein n=1 Tax=unclassified Streptomyces TaxID=2593676 RepID=UPI00365AB472
MNHKSIRIAAVTACAALAVGITGPSASAVQAHEGKSFDTAIEAAAVVEKATGTADVVKNAPSDAENAALATVSGGVVAIPKQAHRGVSLISSDGATLRLGLPSAGAAQGVATPGGTVVYGAGDASANTAVQATEKGFRATVTLKDADAPTEYRFPLHLPEGTEPKLQDDGSVSFVGADGAAEGGIAAPWAKDAHGDKVDTAYRLDGDTLVQTVKADENTAFPVVADPSGWWGWTKCTAAITGTIAGNLLIASKIAKAGGVAKVIARLKAAKNAQDRYKAIIAAVGEVTGADTIIKYCK